MNDVNIK